MSKSKKKEKHEEQTAQTNDCWTCSLLARYLIITGPDLQGCYFGSALPAEESCWSIIRLLLEHEGLLLQKQSFGWAQQLSKINREDKTTKTDQQNLYVLDPEAITSQ